MAAPAAAPALLAIRWRARRAVAAALLFLLAAALAGLELPAGGGVAWRVFGLVEATLALVLSYLLVERRVWARPRTPTRALAVGYGALATAQLWQRLLPPGGALRIVVVVAVTFALWGALGRAAPRRVLVSLGVLAALLALVRYEIAPAGQALGPEPGTAWGLGDLAESARRALLGAEPERPAGQLVAATAVAAWAVATALLRPPPPRRPPRS